jgi:hypothetical protein
MALQVWLPLNNSIDNLGLMSVTCTALGTVSYEDGKIGKAFSRGSTQIPDGVRLNTNFLDMFNGSKKCSVAVWVKPAGNHVNYNGTILSSGNWNSKTWAFGLNQNNSKVDVFCGGYSTYVNCAVPVGEWTHLVSVYDNRSCKLYKNGVFVASYTARKDFDSDSQITCVGRETYANGYFGFNGMINDLRIYDHCLSAKEIKEISQGLVLHYKLDSVKDNGLLPAGLELYESIQGDGSSWINTLVPYDSSKNTYKIKCKFSQPAYQYNYDPVFAAYADDNHKCLRIIRGANDSKMWVQYNTSPGTGSSYRVEFTTANSNIREVTITSSTVTLLENGNTTTYNVPIGSGTALQTTFRLLSSTDAQPNKAKSVIYYWTICDGDTMLGNFVPATYFGKKGMWDTVTGKFFGNDGTGDFIMGNRRTITEYTYLQNDTSSWIDTGVIPKTTTNFEMKYASNSISAETVYFGCSTASTYNSGNNYSLDIRQTTGDLLYTFRSSGYDSTEVKVASNTPFIVRLTGNTFYANDTPYTVARASSHPNLSLFLFGRNVNGTIGTLRAGKLYYCKIYSGSDLIRDYVPVSFDGTLGLFDKVDLKFYPNAGTGTFTAGTVVQGIVPDYSGYGHDGAVTGTIQTASNTSRYNTSLMITDGLENYIKSPPVRTDGGAITMNIWIKSNGTAPTGGFHMPFEAKNGAHREMSIGSTGYLRGGLHIGGTRYVANTPSSSNVLTDGSWHMVTLTYDGAAIKRYIDAKMLSSTAVTGSLTAPEIEYYFGRYGTSTDYSCKDMQLSDARIYATALSEDDIVQLYKTSASVDNLANLHSFQISEEGSKPSVAKTGVVSSVGFTELSSRTRILNDGSVWFHVLHHENPADTTNMFTSSNCWNYDNGSTLYSSLWILKNNDWIQDGKYELLAAEKLTNTSTESLYRWKQTSNPALTSTITGFEVIAGSGSQFKGLKTTGSYGAMHNGAAWYCCFGAYQQYQGGVPGFTNTSVTTGSLDLYIRVPYVSAKGAVSTIASFYQNDINASQVLEV